MPKRINPSTVNPKIFLPLVNDIITSWCFAGDIDYIKVKKIVREENTLYFILNMAAGNPAVNFNPEDFFGSSEYQELDIYIARIADDRFTIEDNVRDMGFGGDENDVFYIRLIS
jgi:hypothetical protein